ncbi:MAG: M23 family metallopeptidase [Mycoplasmatota bacterium]
MDNSSLKKIKKEIKKEKQKKLNKNIYKVLIKLQILILVTLISVILLKSNDNLKTLVNDLLFENNFSFVKVNELYNKYFGGIYKIEESVYVFNEQLEYSELEEYKDGVKLLVTDSYLVPIQQDGMVIFIGTKDDIENLVIIEQVDGVEVWYANITNLNVMLYDYVYSGNILGQTIDNELYMAFKKDKEVLDYQTYIN